jgi:hypothetical protein
MELLDISLSTYLQFEDEFCQQKGGMTIGNSLSPVVSNIFMERFEEIALDTADHKPTKWLIYRRHFRGLATLTSKTAAISSPS